MKRLFSYAVLIALMLITAGYAIADFANDLVVYFTFDNVKGKRVLDESGNGLDAEIVKNTKFVEGKYGNAVRITRETEDCVNVPVSDALEINEQITMMAWVYHEDWTRSSSQWFDKGSANTETNKLYGMGVFDVDDLQIAPWFNEKSVMMIRLGGEIRRSFISKHQLKNGTWHHVVGTCTGSFVKMYLDGEAILNIHRGDFNRINFNGANNKDLRIGCVKNKPNYAFEDGSIDEVAIWNRALSETEIRTAMRRPLLSVSPKDKVATTWGNIKRKSF
ncbi:MAG: LamG domain-containing protein [Candidatus Poribacteria bacterium]|nr:LamG domain-containing protein [Candidatus Poribacteria bacterium]